MGNPLRVDPGQPRVQQQLVSQPDRSLTGGQQPAVANNNSVQFHLHLHLHGPQQPQQQQGDNFQSSLQTAQQGHGPGQCACHTQTSGLQQQQPGGVQQQPGAGNTLLDQFNRQRPASTGNLVEPAAQQVFNRDNMHRPDFAQQRLGENGSFVMNQGQPIDRSKAPNAPQNAQSQREFTQRVDRPGQNGANEQGQRNGRYYYDKDGKFLGGEMTETFGNQQQDYRLQPDGNGGIRAIPITRGPDGQVTEHPDKARSWGADQLKKPDQAIHDANGQKVADGSGYKETDAGLSTAVKPMLDWMKQFQDFLKKFNPAAGGGQQTPGLQPGSPTPVPNNLGSQPDQPGPLGQQAPQQIPQSQQPDQQEEQDKEERGLGLRPDLEPPSWNEFLDWLKERKRPDQDNRQPFYQDWYEFLEERKRQQNSTILV